MLQYSHSIPGRVDCQPDEAKKWTPFDFEATEVERQSNPRGTGNQVARGPSVIKHIKTSSYFVNIYHIWN